MICYRKNLEQYIKNETRSDFSDSRFPLLFNSLHSPDSLKSNYLCTGLWSSLRGIFISIFVLLISLISALRLFISAKLLNRKYTLIYNISTSDHIFDPRLVRYGLLPKINRQVYWIHTSSPKIFLRFFLTGKICFSPILLINLLPLGWLRLTDTYLPLEDELLVSASDKMRAMRLHFIFKYSAKFIIKFGYCERLVTIDDFRYIGEIVQQAKIYHAKVIALQHGRFNDFHIGTHLIKFDNYFVWSDYYASQLISAGYDQKNIFVSGYPDKNTLNKDCLRTSSFIFLEEDGVSFENLLPFISVIASKNNLIIYKPKRGRITKEVLEFTRNDRFFIDQENSLKDCITRYKAAYVCGFFSGGLLECLRYGALGLVLLDKDVGDYGDHLYKELKLPKIKSCHDMVEYSRMQKVKFKELQENCNKLAWGNSAAIFKSCIIAERALR